MKNVKIQIFDVLEPCRPYWNEEHAFMYDTDNDYDNAPARLCHPNVPYIFGRRSLILSDTRILKVEDLINGLSNDEGLAIELSNMEVLYFGIMSEVIKELALPWPTNLDICKLHCPTCCLGQGVNNDYYQYQDDTVNDDMYHYDLSYTPAPQPNNTSYITPLQKTDAQRWEDFYKSSFCPECGCCFLL